MIRCMTRFAVLMAVLPTWFCLGSATAMGVSPILVELSPARRVASVTLTNPAASPKSVQAQLLTWVQQEGIDQYAETDALIVTPVIAQIAPGGTQVFRVALRSRATLPVEQAYRLIFEDVTEEVASPSASNVNLRYRISMPVMSAPLEAGRPMPRWSLCPAAPGKTCIRLDNDGNRRLRLSSLVLEGKEGWRKEVSGAGTVLAGAWKEWRFDQLPGQNSPTRVSADAEGSLIQGELTPAR